MARRDRLGRKVRGALAAFGLTVRDCPGGAEERGARGGWAQPINEHARELAAGQHPWSLALVCGPSGAGKSTLLRRVGVLTREAGDRVIDARLLLARADPKLAVVETFAGGLDGERGCLRTLAAAGLADARLCARRAGELSDGERARLGVALAMHTVVRSGRRTLVLLDEFGTGLDAPTARALAIGVRRWVDRLCGAGRVRVLCAGVREDVEAWLSPDVLVRMTLRGGVRIDGVSDQTPNAPHIEPGTLADYDALSHWHYRQDRPAVPRRVLRAIDPSHGTVGVLVTAMPTLNARWRERAWGGRFVRSTKREQARRINDELRCIARVVVEPRWRGTGVATSLVRAYLRDAETPCTEAVAAMGGASPMFERAGMTRLALGPTAACARLLDAIACAGLHVDELVDPERFAELVRTRPLLERELWLFANASRATRGAIADGLQAVIEDAARRVGSAGWVFVHDGC